MKKLFVFIFVTIIHLSSSAHPQFSTKERSALEVVSDYFAYLKTGQFERLMSLFTEDIVWHQPGCSVISHTYFGKEELTRFFNTLISLSEGTFKIDHIDSPMLNTSLNAQGEQEEWVVVNLHFSARKGATTMSMNGTDLMRIKNGKIIEMYLFSSDQNAEDHFWGFQHK